MLFYWQREIKILSDKEVHKIHGDMTNRMQTNGMQK